ncbi:MAG: sigma-70 family RNA polymerase sigma factor [Planctomycetota bacterium]|nr:MAG: sigma-70 family RNA polymerase sigma factor [Planctomycetota bacterium]
MIKEETLIERAVSGDEAALEAVMLSHHTRLAQEVDRKTPTTLRGVIAADDVLQEAYVIVFREIRRFQWRGAGSFYAWVATIAERRLFDAIKAERAAKRGGGRARVQPADADEHAILGWLEVLSVYERTPSRSVAGREAIAALNEAIAALNPAQREAMRLRYVEGLPVSVAAERMQRSEGAVCQLCQRALKNLRAALGSSTRFSW